MADHSLALNPMPAGVGADDTPVGMHWPVGDRLRLPVGEARRFIVSVDTEEEFDWGRPFDRGSNRTSSIAALTAATKRFNTSGVKPVFLCDWPVVTNSRSSVILRELAQSATCEIGAHLHPWVNPPHEEAVNTRNSFTGNLPQSLQWEKLCALTQALTDLTGRSPIVFRAGRYGLGTHTHKMLAALGYRFDVSIRSGFDYSNEAGPNFTGYPHWAWKTPEDLIEIPLSATVTGALRKLPFIKLPGMSRLNLQARVPLTPEGVPIKKALAAIRQLHAEGCEIFSLSFHSPTLVPGHTSYVRNQADLDQFWRWWDEVLACFAQLGVLPSTHAELLPLLGDAR